MEPGSGKGRITADLHRWMCRPFVAQVRVPETWTHPWHPFTGQPNPLHPYWRSGARPWTSRTRSRLVRGRLVDAERVVVADHAVETPHGPERCEVVRERVVLRAFDPEAGVVDEVAAGEVTEH